MNKLFNNIGRKIKVLATVMCILGTLGTTGLAIYFFTLDRWYSDLQWLGLPILLLGPIVPWVGNFFIYGFGELIEKTTEIAKNTGNLRAENKENAPESIPEL